MATRPVFVPDLDPDNSRLVHAEEVDFQWVPDRSAAGKKRNMAKLHAAAEHRNLGPLLEVSPASADPLGNHICAANLAVEDERSFLVPLLAAYHGSRVFAGGGPYTDLYRKPPGVISADARLSQSGKPVGFRFMGLEWGAKSETLFYDWLVMRAISRYRRIRAGVRLFLGFTDIDCRSHETGICHARSCAYFTALDSKNLLNEVVDDQDRFIAVMLRDPFYEAGDRNGR
jgi:hypothetical protein